MPTINLKPEGLSAEEILSLPDDETPQSPSDLPSPDEVIRRAEQNDPTASDTVPGRGIPRTGNSPPVPTGPPRKATQVRPMSDIAPLNDFDRDRDIRSYASEKAREYNVRFGGDPFVPRHFPDVAMQWVPPIAYYYPLYFQDSPMERYGHTYHPLIQPLVSNARFGAQFILMPYQMAIMPPWEMQTALGWYRPGDATPRLHYQVPLSAKAAIVEAATVTGIHFLVIP